MIRISCSKLEQVKNNPRLYGQMLAIGEGKKSGGQHGMFAHMKDTIREVHAGDITVTQGVRELRNRFLQFDETLKNKSKQEELIEHYHIYHKLFAQQEWAFLHGTKNINWPVHKEVALTGHTPWVFKNEEGYVAYYITETALAGWRNELRFPLIQRYLAEKILHCELGNIKLGYYALSTAMFDLKCFDESAIKQSVEVASNVFKVVYDAYHRSKQVLKKEQPSSIDASFKEQKNGYA